MYKTRKAWKSLVKQCRQINLSKLNQRFYILNHYYFNLVHINTNYLRF
jgi:hypothetical protein